MTKTEKALVWFLRLSAVVFGVAIIAVFLPTAWMIKVGEHMKATPLPTEYPIFQYLARSESLLYAMLGGLCWILAGDLRRYRTLVIYLCAAGVVYAPILFMVDLYFKMPARWSTHEGPMVFVFSAVMLAMSLKIRREGE